MPCSGLRFLVVEDHEVQRRVLVALLTGLGAAMVYSAADGREALDVIRDPAKPLDIVLSDISMPGMDGAELVRNLGAVASPVALIINSALSPALLSSVANMSLAYKVNLLGVISKPLSMVKLTPLVKLYRENRERESSNLFSLAEVAQAWARDEFEPCYEPTVSLATTEVVGFHASAHWRHPTRGILGPQVFMHSVDAYGLHDEMVWLTLGKAMGALRSWAVARKELRLSVSLSVASLSEGNLGGRLKRMASDRGLAPQRLALGIAESSLEADRGPALATLSRLRAMGFGLAMEDFGTGEMGAEQLARVGLTELRISRNLVSGFREDNSARSGLIIALDTAHQLKIATVAQGIKRLDEWNMLQAWGCEFGRGSFISRPLPADDVTVWLKDRDNRARALGPTGSELDLASPGAMPPGLGDDALI